MLPVGKVIKDAEAGDLAKENDDLEQIPVLLLSSTFQPQPSPSLLGHLFSSLPLLLGYNR